MISSSKGFVFIHVPKTGGNSIQRCLLEYADDEFTVNPDQDGRERFGLQNTTLGTRKHSPLAAYRIALGPDRFAELQKFATARNPWERLISWYFSPHRGRTDWDRAEFTRLIGKWPTLRHYVVANDRLGGALDDDLDLMLRYETLDRDFREMCERIGIPPRPLPTVNKSDHRHYGTYYDVELVDLVRARHHEEIEHCGYEFEKNRAAMFAIGSPPAESTVIVHVGFPKAGSTTLQTFLKGNRERLASLGYRFPETARGPLHGHHNLVWDLMAPDRVVGGIGSWNELAGEMAGLRGAQIILSSEHLTMLDDQALDAVRDRLEAFSVKIVAYVRRQDLQIQSSYSQRVKHGRYTGDFASFIGHVLSRETRSLKYHQVLDPWAERFGVANLVVRPLETSQLNGTLCHDFLRSIGYPEHQDAELDFVSPANTSPSIKTLETIRFVQQALVDRGVDQDVRLQVCYGLLKWAQRAGWNEEKLSLLTARDHLEIMQVFEASNARLAQRYLGRSDGRLFLEPFELSPVTGFSIDQLDAEEVAEVFHAVLDRLVGPPAS